jgi:hypothetical protein
MVELVALVNIISSFTLEIMDDRGKLLHSMLVSKCLPNSDDIQRISDAYQ